MAKDEEHDDATTASDSEEEMEEKPRPKKSSVAKAKSKDAPKKSAASKREVAREADPPPPVPPHADVVPASPIPTPPVWSIITQVVFVVAAAVAVYAFVSTGRDGETRRRCAPTCLMKPSYTGYERKAPNFALKNMKGETVQLSDYRGKVVVLNFWTKTCGPCMEEMPDIAELAKILKKYDDVAVLAVSIDEGPDDVKDTLHGLLREDPPFPVLFDPDDKIVREVYGTRLFPETWIVDKNGVIRARFDGAREWASSAAVELIDQIRGGGFCPLEVRGGHAQGDGAHLCEALSGG